MERYLLDCRGICCPMPMVRLFKKNSTIMLGDILEIVCDDAAFPHDIKAWCEQTGNTLIEIKKEGNLTTAVIKKTKM